ncbi:hypothetical protein HY988_06310 [Candidatus Micrarchaeota archaeon]|nr:hypothetical protein [Candidatus Micrarchaeota archaeon]
MKLPGGAENLKGPNVLVQRVIYQNVANIPDGGAPDLSANVESSPY